jgi:hypothetical protein
LKVKAAITAAAIAVAALSATGSATAANADVVAVELDAPQYPSNCRVQQFSSRTAGAYCSSMDSSDGYRVRGRKNTWQGQSSFAGSWAVRGELDGSHASLPSGQSIVSGSLWIEKLECCFSSFFASSYDRAVVERFAPANNDDGDDLLCFMFPWKCETTTTTSVFCLLLVLFIVPVFVLNHYY